MRPCRFLYFIMTSQSGVRTHTRHSGEMIELLRNSALNRSSTGDAALKFENTIGKLLFILTAEAVLTSIYNLCFGTKIRKICIPLQTPVLLYKSEVKGGIHSTGIFSSWVFLSFL